jgi:hypothetical protein
MRLLLLQTSDFFQLLTHLLSHSGVGAGYDRVSPYGLALPALLRRYVLMPASHLDAPGPVGSLPGNGRPMRRPGLDGPRSGSGWIQAAPATWSSSVTTARLAIRPTARMAAWGGLRMAVNRSTPNMPRLERVKVPPCRSSSLSRPCPGANGQVSQLPRNGAQPQPIRAPHHRHDQARVERGRHADVYLVPFGDLAVHEGAVGLRVLLSTPRRRPGSAATVRVTRGLSVAAPVFQILHDGQCPGHIRIDGNGELRRLAHTGRHAFGDGAANTGQRDHAAHSR